MMVEASQNHIDTVGVVGCVPVCKFLVICQFIRYAGPPLL